ncbi:hypothetical protein [Parachitinimonas caeni]|uniref:Lipoprotein n=1 Tax=Parachitinimonas caeni TaxID=3031301 RepID=A0ABT7DVY6_9NEIS|nr:hypothetical protein [Parachitinimonas caeni]MDK2124221.1 hypothetical protein [Parachitinimonas caeni]
MKKISVLVTALCVAMLAGCAYKPGQELDLKEEPEFQTGSNLARKSRPAAQKVDPKSIELRGVPEPAKGSSL